MLIRNQRRWAGYLTRMDDDRLPEQLLYGELQRGRRQIHKPKKRFKDVVQNNLKAISIDVEDWEKMTENRLSVWRKVIYDGCKGFEARRVDHSIVKRACGNKTLPTSQTLFRLDMFVIFAGLACQKLGLLAILDHMVANNHKQTMLKSLLGSLLDSPVNFVTKYIDLQPG